MKFQGLDFHLTAAVMFSLVGCASTSSISTSAEPVKAEAAFVASPAPSVESSSAEASALKPVVNNNYLICKASRSRFHYDWSAGSLNKGEELIDQNSIRYEFRSASKPAGSRGEHLKVGECGWAEEALAVNTSGKNRHSQVVFKSLSDEATQTFYKMKTGKVFKVPVRQTKNGLVAAPGGVSVIR